MKKKLFLLALIIVMIFTMSSCGSNSDSKVEYNIENDILSIKAMFSCVDKNTLVETFNENIIEDDTLQMHGTFAGIEGTYEFEFYEEGDNDIHGAGEIYSITFC